MGGRLGLRGTDGRVAEALARGAVPVSPSRAGEMLRALKPLRGASEIQWITCRGPMGSDSLVEAGFPLSSLEIASSPPVATSSDDTKLACREFGNRGAELIVFCGGGGASRGVVGGIVRRGPVLRVPAGGAERY